MAQRRRGRQALPLDEETRTAAELGFQPGHINLTDRYGIPPFSVLDARQGYWQARKRAWLRLGIQSELGRGEGTSLLYAPDDYTKEMMGKGLNHFREQEKGRKADARAYSRDLMRGEIPGYGGTPPDGTPPARRKHAADGRDVGVVPGAGGGMGPPITADGRENQWYARSRQDEDGEVAVMGTSIFDPVLCELAYCWFSPQGGRVLDPFAGGSVRGIVAGMLGRHYVGIDLRPEQTEANEAQRSRIWERQAERAAGLGSVRWITGDGLDVVDLAGGVDFGDSTEYDFLFTCPPYYNLELYSYDPRDISNMGTYNDFLRTYRDIIEQSASLLSNNRFAAVVVGDIRDPETGIYRNFVSHTISIFQKHAGMRLYNQAILVTAVGSLPVRIGKQFTSGRKLGNTHQSMLVFVKGSWKRAAQNLGAIEMGLRG